MKRAIKAALILAGMAYGAAGATWYVRPDGGTRQQCTGRVDAPYSGEGTDQPCAFRNAFYLWTDNDYSNPTWEWIISGGDTVIFKNGVYRFGPADSALDSFDPRYCTKKGYTLTCHMPAPPSGSPGNPTRLAGEGYASGCSVKPQLWGSGDASTVIYLNGTSYVELSCLEITDHAACAYSETNGPTVVCNYLTSQGLRP